MENLNEQQKANLLRQLATKFKTAKIAQKLGALAIAGATALAITSCSFTTPSHSQPGENETKQTETESNSKYSDMLINVFNNKEYQALIEQARANPELWKSAKFDPHPYGFLEDEGYDVNAIKNGDTECYSMSYVLDEEPNNLYIQTRVLVDNSYYATYLIRYSLSKKEMKDYQYMHGKDRNNEAFSIQAVFLNDEISRTKEATIVGESKFAKNVIERLDSEYPTKFKAAPTKPCHYIVLDPNAEENTMRVILTPTSGAKPKMMTSMYIVELDILSTLIDLKKNGDIFMAGPTLIRTLNTTEHDATCFYPQDVYLEYAIDRPLEQN